MANYFHTTPVAFSVPFDPAHDPSLAFVSTDVQSVIEELGHRAAVSASPGFTWGRSGNISAGAYLSNDSVPSNVSGRTVLLSTATITTITYANDGVGTFDITVQEHDGITYTDLTTQSVVASRAGTFGGLTVSATTGKMLAIKVSSGSAKNLVVAVIIKGTI